MQRFHWTVCALVASCAGDSSSSRVQSTPPAPIDAQPAFDAATSSPDAAAPGDVTASESDDESPARLEDRAEFANDVLTRCPFDSPEGNDRYATMASTEAWHTDWLPADQRGAWLYPDDDDSADHRVNLPTRVARVHGPDGHEYLLTVGLTISGVDESDCSRLVWFDWSTRNLVWRGDLASTRGTVESGAMYWIRTDGPYAGAGLLVWTGAGDAVVSVRFIDGPTVLAPIPLGVFQNGQSAVLFTVNDGMNFRSPTDVRLVTRGDGGLIDLLGVYAGLSTDEGCDSLFDDDTTTPLRPDRPRCRVYPPGGFRVIARGREPRIEVTGHVGHGDDGADGNGAGDEDTPWYRRTESYRRRVYRFDPAREEFVPMGRTRTVRLRPRVEQLAP